MQGHTHKGHREIVLKVMNLDGPAIRRKATAFITFKRFARIASKLRFAIFYCPKTQVAKKGFSSGTLRRFARRFARVGPPKVMNFRVFPGYFQGFQAFSGFFSTCPFWVCPLDPSNTRLVVKATETTKAMRVTFCQQVLIGLIFNTLERCMSLVKYERNSWG